MSSPRAVVIRDGEKQRISGREVVRGDILILSEGERVPADAIILSCSNLKVDESLLTGESVPVRKIETNDLSKIGAPGGDDLPFLYSGTLVVAGTCIAEVIGIGMNTEMGKIGKSLQNVKEEETKLQIEVNNFVKIFALWGIFLCLVVVLIYGFTLGNWTNGLLTGITLAMSVLPEEFPVVLTVFLAIGAWRMSKKNVLTRKQHVIQSLGSATVLCVDKTGTLTMNQMNLKQIYTKGKFFDISRGQIDKTLHEIIEFGVLASQKDPFDPMEKSLYSLINKTKVNHFDSWKLQKDFPLTKDILATTGVWKSNSGKLVAATKGAPESIFDLCHLTKKEIRDLSIKVEKMASKGYRVLGVAKADIKEFDDNSLVHDFDFKFVGLFAFEDPVRPGVARAIKECYNAGIKVIMITGDYPITAKNIGSQIGLSNCNFMTGQELDTISDTELKSRISNVCIFARVVPEQKLRIIEALKSNGEIVGMTGDGVNDAPALKAAHIGIAMGMRGTDVAREASGLVILDDDFSSIVSGVKMGRRIFDNIRKAFSYIFAVHFPIVGITLIALILKWPLILLPAHIVFLELIIDPACSIVFEQEREEKNIMNKKPRDVKEKIFNKSALMLSIIQGIFVLIVTALMFKLSLVFGASETEARTVSFATLILSNLSLIISNLSWKESALSNVRSGNKSLIWIASGAILLLIFTIYVPFLRELFSFNSLNILSVSFVLIAGIIVLVFLEVFKKIVKIE
jgi:Ca2+-transporting ATPase